MGIRAMLDVDGLLYLVAGQGVWTVDQTATATFLGSIPTTGVVSLSRNRHVPPQISIADTQGYYAVIQSGAITVVTNPAYPSIPTSCAWLDGYTGLAFANGSWGISGNDTADTFNPLDFANAESNPDAIVRIAVQGREFVVFGTRSVELWIDAPSGQSVDFPFVRNSVREIGLLAAGSVSLLDQLLYFVAHDGTVRRLNGYSPERISDHPVERAISSQPDPTTITATSWSTNGHNFYAVSGDTFTWVYDATTGLWHERMSAGLNRWKVGPIVKLGNRLIAGHYSQNALYTMSPAAAAEGSDPLIMTIQTPMVHAYPIPLRFDVLYVDTIAGTGTNTGVTQDDNPSVMISHSEDGGVTWSAERRIGTGTIGQRRTRVLTRRLGTSREDGRTFRLSMSAAVVKGVTGIAVDATKMTAS